MFWTCFGVWNITNYSFRQKFVGKFTPKLHETNVRNKNEKHADKPTSFVKKFPPIPMKFPKEVKEISKFFKKNTQPIERKDARKYYA